MPTNANSTAWKGDNYKFVGKAFQSAYANRMNKFKMIMGEVNSKSIDYEMNGTGGYGELSPYNGADLNMGEQKRGFRTIITPGEFQKSIPIGYKQAKVDKLGETKKVGTKLGDSAAMTVYLHCLRMFGNAFNAKMMGGDGQPWASTKHPVAAKMDQGRKRVPDPDSGTFSNLITDELSVDAITKAQSLAGRYRTPDGLPFLCQMDCVLVSPELEATAKKIFGENSKLRPLHNPGDDTNAANPVYEDMTYMVVGGGKDGFGAKQWAICDRTLMKELVNIVYITKPMVMNSDLDNPLIDLYTAYVDFGVGWGDSRQIIFSNPA